MNDIVAALLLGLIEGLTEFVPVSSTAHLLLAKMAFGLTGPSWDSFIILCQLGAILALVAVYFARLFQVLLDAPRDPKARRFILSVTLAFVPSVVIGVLAYDFVKKVLFESPTVVCTALIVGGFVLLAVDRWAPKPRYDDAMKLPLGVALVVGLMQCLAMIPGVSRSGGTITGAVLMGVDRRAAAEFSFYLSIPTMVAAFAKDFWESRHVLFVGNHLGILAIGLVAAFVSGLFVVKTLLQFVAQRGLSPFGWWRIAVGVIGLVLTWGVHPAIGIG